MLRKSNVALPHNFCLFRNLRHFTHEKLHRVLCKSLCFPFLLGRVVGVSVCGVAVDSGLFPSGQTNDFKIAILSFPA